MQTLVLMMNFQRKSLFLGKKTNKNTAKSLFFYFLGALSG